MVQFGSPASGHLGVLPGSGCAGRISVEAMQSRPNDEGPRLCGADDKIVKIAAHLKSARLFDPADPHRLKAHGSDQVLDFVVPMLVHGRVEQNRGLGRPVARGHEEIGRHGAERIGKACPDRQPPSNNLARWLPFR